MLKFLVRGKGRFIFCFLALTLWQCPCFAQSCDQSPNQQASAADQPVPPAIQRQLDAMKKRIDALEAELKNRTAQAQTAESAKKAPSTTSERAAISTVPRGEVASSATNEGRTESSLLASAQMNSDAPQAEAVTTEKKGAIGAVRVCGLHLAERKQPREESASRYEVLYARIPS